MIIRKLRHELCKNKNKSVLLLGPRQVGKSTLVQDLATDLTLNLADEEVFIDVASDPAFLKKQIETSAPNTVFIEEIQRFPRLLNSTQVELISNPC